MKYSYLMFKNSFFLTLPVPVFFRGALIVLFFALRQAQVQLGPAALPVQRQRHQRIALALDGTDQPVEFAPMEQQLAGPYRVGVNVS